MNKFLNAFVILALFLAGVSPACAFVSGKETSIIEICTEFGTKLITLDEQGQPTKDQNNHKQMKQKDCAFCFAKVHGKGLSAYFTDALISFSIQKHYLTNVTAHHKLYDAHTYTARAPPTLS